MFSDSFSFCCEGSGNSSRYSSFINDYDFWSQLSFSRPFCGSYEVIIVLLTPCSWCKHKYYGDFLNLYSGCDHRIQLKHRLVPHLPAHYTWSVLEPQKLKQIFSKEDTKSCSLGDWKHMSSFLYTKFISWASNTVRRAFFCFF